MKHFFRLILCAVTLAAFGTVARSQTFVQVNSATPQGAVSSVTIKYNSAQVVGHLNVVVVGWNDTTASVSSVKDSLGNAYALAVGPTKGTALSESIYYAPNIAAAAAGANSVTVAFSQAAQYPDIRILEYGGVSVLDAKTGASGSGSTASSGAVTTTTANELIFGADMVSTLTSGAGSGFASRIITSPDGDIAEDRTVTATGSYSATAAVQSGDWVMQIATFVVPGGSSNTAPVATVSPSSVAFGSVPVGSTSAAQAVTLKNYGTASLTINSISITGTNASEFGRNTTCGTSLAAGASCTINVTFSPSTLNSRSATLSISDNASGSPQAVSLSGSGAGASCNNHFVTLTWTASTTSGVSAYDVYRCAGSGCTPNSKIGSVGSATTTFVDSNVSSGATYSWGATAVDLAGESSLSNIAVATIPTP